MLMFICRLYILMFPIGWVDVTWDKGGSNSYRMGAEGKYDLTLAPAGTTTDTSTSKSNNSEVTRALSPEVTTPPLSRRNTFSVLNRSNKLASSTRHNVSPHKNRVNHFHNSPTLTNLLCSIYLQWFSRKKSDVYGQSNYNASSSSNTNNDNSRNASNKVCFYLPIIILAHSSY